MSVCACAYLDDLSVYVRVLVLLRKTKVLCGVYGVAVKCVTCRHFLITNWSEINDILLS